MKFWMHRIGTAFAALLVSAGFAAAQPLDQVTFATNWVAEAEHGGFYQALVDGTYRKHGLDVTILPGGPNVNHRLQLLAGKISST
jgi:NitT/TauT family transport system substrate-binding protein